MTGGTCRIAAHVWPTEALAPNLLAGKTMEHLLREVGPYDRKDIRGASSKKSKL